MNYQNAAKEAIRAFDAYRRSRIVKEIERTAEFRKLTTYESTGVGNNITHVLFGLEFCDKNGENYREILISVVDGMSIEGPVKTKGFLTDVRLYTITKVR